MIDKSQVRTVTHKVDFKSNRHAKTFFAAATAHKFVVAHTSAQLNGERLLSAGMFTQQRFLV